MVMGIAGAGVSLASGNISLKLAPKGQATAYLATNTITNSIAAGLAPILGGQFADFFSNRQLDWVMKYTGPDGELTLPTLNLQQWDFFFVIAFIIGLYSLHRLAMIKEAGEVDEGVVTEALFGEMRSQVRTLSSIDGIKQMISFPLATVRTLAVKVTPNGLKHMVTGYKNNHTKPVPDESLNIDITSGDNPSPLKSSTGFDTHT
jgi:MFS family permease